MGSMMGTLYDNQHNLVYSETEEVLTPWSGTLREKPLVTWRVERLQIL